MTTTTTEARNAFHKACDHAVSLGYEDIRESGWKFSFNNRRAALGVCNYTHRTISLSMPFMEVNTIEEMYNTIVHEVAHALTPGAKHGPRWQFVFRQLGGDGQRVNRGERRANSVEARWHVVDKRDGKVVAKYHRKPRRNFSQCVLRGDPSSLGNLVLVANH